MSAPGSTLSHERPFTVVRGAAPDVRALAGAVAAVGNFDGVHLGHKAVIGRAQALAARLGRPACVLTFDPHPRAFFRPDEPIFPLTPEPVKLALLARMGLDGAIVLPFDSALAAMTAQDFLADLFVRRLGLSGVVAGYDFHFGNNRQGTPAFLAEQGRALGLAVDIVEPMALEGGPVSSTAIRRALAEGGVEQAARLLGYRWVVRAAVQHGDKRGRTLGYPTANLRMAPGCALRHGIYAVRIAIDGAVHDGVASFGRRPTFDDGAPLLEVFVFDWSGDLYGRTVDVEFAAWLRGELKFDSAEALVARMDKDSLEARAALARAPDVPAPSALPLRSV
ncbi:riboflavin biosynthesis protein RibF [Alsobacter metallidurans]|uniref:Riboflavin biosynthesis protein n=1 Tax=Alsobacter metallidurans TaxID=340221 RepID=A0A917I4I3_9HYPH|nr:riboflavin biosynthesis protein RibF [Alsobacter metallidurans]